MPSKDDSLRVKTRDITPLYQGETRMPFNKSLKTAHFFVKNAWLLAKTLLLAECHSAPGAS
jgi:hypothetical protein